jgi:hypothetical protein
LFAESAVAVAVDVTQYVGPGCPKTLGERIDVFPYRY